MKPLTVSSQWQVEPSHHQKHALPYLARKLIEEPPPKYRLFP